MLEILCDAGTWDRRDLEATPFPDLTPDSLPTWTPDLRQESRSSRLPWLKHYFRQRLASKTLKFDPAAAPITVVKTCRGFSLDIEVLVIDNIKAVMPAPEFPSAKIFDPQKENSFDAVVNHVKWCRQVYEAHRNPTGYPISFRPEGDPDTPFWATVVSFSKYTGTPSAIRGAILTAEGLRDMSRLFREYCLDDGGAFSGSRESQNIDIAVRRAQLLKRMGPEASQKNFDARMALDMYDIIRETMDGVRFIVTHDGFVGLTPPTRLFNCDIIAMIRGCRIPFILRPVTGTDSYALVGSCYIFGMMDAIIQGNYKTRHIF